MKKVLSGLLFIVYLASCYRSEPEPEFKMKLVLPADSMVSLLSDLHTIDGIINLYKDKKKPVEHLSNEYFEFILRNHAINKDIFEESMRYYAFHTEELDEIYEQVIIDLSKRESMALPGKDTLNTVP